MKLWETILLSLIVVTFIVGLHQTYTNGFVESYWIFMLNIILLSLFRMIKSKTTEKSVNK